MELLDTNIIELEKVVLGCLMLGAPFEEVSQYLDADDFFTLESTMIYKAIKKRALEGKPIDSVSLLDEGINIEASSVVYQYRASPANAAHYAKQLSDLSVTRQIRVLLADCATQITAPTHLEMSSALMTKLDNLIHREMKSSSTWRDIIDCGIEEICRLAEPGNQPLYSGLPSLDAKLSSIHGSRIIVLAGRPGDGKTALAQQIALESAKQGKAVGILSLEMSTSELAIRSIANSFSINGTLLARGDYSSLSDFMNHESYEQFKEYPIYVDTENYRLEAITARLAEWKRKHSIDFAIIDYVGLVEVDSRGNPNETLGIISRALKQLCKRLNIPILLLCQLNRSIEKEEREPRLSDLRESGHLEQDADMVLILKPYAVDESAPHTSEKLITLYAKKNRNGTIGAIGTYSFDGGKQQFKESS